MIIYSKEKKELVIPTGFDVDCSEAVEAAREEGYGLGFTSGQQSVRAHIGTMSQTPHWNDVSPWNGVMHYLPSPSSDTEGWNHVIIDYNNIHNEGLEDGYNSGYESGSTVGYNSGYAIGYENGNDAGYNSGYTTGYDSGNTDGYGSGYTEGYDSGYTTGYDSGYTIGRNTKNIRIDGHSEYDNTKQGVWYVGSYAFNGGEKITPVESAFPEWNEGQGIEYEYRDGNIIYFGVSGITMNIDSISQIDLDLAFLRKESDRSTPSPDELNITINDIPIDIRSSSKTVEWVAPDDNYAPQVVYSYHFSIRSIIPSQYGIGYDDGYQSGYTVGYEDGYSAERPTDSIVITNNGVYTNPSGGWSSVIANVHEETPEILLQDLVVDLDYSSASGFSGDETFVASEGYDGLNSVEVKGMSAALYHANLNNTWEGATGGLNNAYYASASTLEITENGTYTASGTGKYEEGRHSCQFPLMFKEVRVNVPVSNICVSGSFTTTANTTFSPSDENVPFLVNMPPIQCLSNLKVDGVAMQTYCENSYMLPAGDHIFWMNYGMLALTNGNPVTFTNSFPNAESITYSRIHQE